MNASIKLCIILLFSASTASADDNEVIIFGSALPVAHWQITNTGMRPGEYASSTQQNKNIIVSRMLSLSKKALSSIDLGNMGIHVKKIEFDLTNLNNHISVDTGEVFGVVLKNATRSKRAIYLEFSKSW